MMYLTKEELVKNIADQSERASAVIEHTDFTSDKFDPNAVITSFLGNIFDSALIVIALEKCAGLGDCHRNAMSIVCCSNAVSRDMKRFIEQISRLRQKYSFEGASSGFDAGECLDFLNAYDCFMFDFIKNSSTVAQMNAEGTVTLKFSSMRNMVEKLLKKSSTAHSESGNTADNSEIAQLLRQNNELLKELLGELVKVNQLLDIIEKKI